MFDTGFLAEFENQCGLRSPALPCVKLQLHRTLVPKSELGNENFNENFTALPPVGERA